MKTYTYKIDGMTCGSCVDTITKRLTALPGVTNVRVSLPDKKVDVIADRAVLLKEIQNAIADLPKYKASFYDDVDANLASHLKPPQEKTFFQIYKPLFTVFAYVFIFSLAYQVSRANFSAHLFMNHLMAGFFIGLSFFKFLDLKSFATTFSNYDPLAHKWKPYGLIYPFIELTLGFLFIADKFLLIANTVTILVLSMTSFGVYKKIKSDNQFQCACLGAGFNLPLSNITIFENLAMIAMALIGILFPF